MRLMAMCTTKLVFGCIFFVGSAMADEISKDQVKPQKPLTKIQQEFCNYTDYGELQCDSPGSGMCWAKGHDPFLDQSPAVVDVGHPDSPNYEKGELCSTFNDRYTPESPLIMEEKPGYYVNKKDCQKMLADRLNVVCRF